MTNPNPFPSAPAEPAVPYHVARARDDAQRTHEMPRLDQMRRIALDQLVPYISPSVVPIPVLDQWFKKAGERSRRAICDWLWAETVRFTQSHGIYGVLTRDGREAFFREFGPALEAKGAGQETWVAYLRTHGAWSGI